jgi:serralysin
VHHLVWPARAGLALLVTASVGALTAVPAQAATTGVAAVVEGTKVNYKAAAGKQNKVVVTLSGRTVTFDDQVAIKAGKGCKQVKGDKTKVKCTTTAKPTRVRVYTYDRNDWITNKSGLPATLNGGSGNDTVVGGARGELIEGETGNDKISGNGGNDTIYSDLGNDVVHGGAGNDLIEDAGGKSSGSDKLYGDDGDDTVFAEAGADRVYGGNGDDLLSGGPDADYIDGGYGDDYLEGNDCYQGSDVGNCHAKDTLIGGPGTDTIIKSA